MPAEVDQVRLRRYTRCACGGIPGVPAEVDQVCLRRCRPGVPAEVDQVYLRRSHEVMAIRKIGSV